MLWANVILNDWRDLGCPGGDTPSGIDTLSPMPRTHLMPRTEAEGVCSETYGHPRPYKREGPEDGASRLWEGSERSGDGFGTNTLWRRKCSTWNKNSQKTTFIFRSRQGERRCRRGRCRRCGKLGRWWRGDSASVSGGIRWKDSGLCQSRSRRES